MISDVQQNKLTKRCTRLTFNAESFEEERILSALVEAIETNRKITVNLRKRVLQFRFPTCSSRKFVGKQ